MDGKIWTFCKILLKEKFEIKKEEEEDVSCVDTVGRGRDEGEERSL